MVTVALAVVVPLMDRVWSVVIWSLAELPLSVLIPVKTGGAGLGHTLATKASVKPPELPWYGFFVGKFVEPVEPAT
jgi:hypothetical protein